MSESYYPITNRLEESRLESAEHCYDDGHIKGSKQHSLFVYMMSEEGLLHAFKECRKGVAWKYSVQKFEMFLGDNIAKLHEQLARGEGVTKGFVCFCIRERGKMRHIQAVHIMERVVQKSLCMNALIPILKPSLIYDSGASLKGKGPTFTRKRIVTHLTRYYREHGSNKGYILITDYHDYFGSIDHAVLIDMLKKRIYDEDLLNLVLFYINCFGNVGLGLGSEVSQVLAIFFLYPIDHFMKEVRHCRYYGRYMDDSYTIASTREELQAHLEAQMPLLEKMHINLNRKKTKIVAIDKPFIFMKCIYRLTSTGKVERRPVSPTIRNQRRKVKALLRIHASCDTMNSVIASYNGVYKELKYRRGQNDLHLLKRRISRRQ